LALGQNTLAAACPALSAEEVLVLFGLKLRFYVTLLKTLFKVISHFLEFFFSCQLAESGVF